MRTMKNTRLDLTCLTYIFVYHWVPVISVWVLCDWELVSVLCSQTRYFTAIVLLWGSPNNSQIRNSRSGIQPSTRQVLHLRARITCDSLSRFILETDHPFSTNPLTLASSSDRKQKSRGRRLEPRYSYVSFVFNHFRASKQLHPASLPTVGPNHP